MAIAACQNVREENRNQISVKIGLTHANILSGWLKSNATSKQWFTTFEDCRFKLPDMTLPLWV